MGLKGDKNTELSNQVAEQLAEKLSSIDGITMKRMFGGSGVFHNDKMFGLVDSKGNAFLKADESIKAQLQAKGSEQHSRMPYYSIPDEIFANHSELQGWAEKAIKASK